MPKLTTENTQLQSKVIAKVRASLTHLETSLGTVTAGTTTNLYAKVDEHILSGAYIK